LAQLVIGERLIFHLVEVSLCWLAWSAARTSSDRPPPAVQRILRHRLLLAEPRAKVSMIS